MMSTLFILELIQSDVYSEFLFKRLKFKIPVRPTRNFELLALNYYRSDYKNNDSFRRVCKTFNECYRVQQIGCLGKLTFSFIAKNVFIFIPAYIVPMMLKFWENLFTDVSNIPKSITFKNEKFSGGRSLQLIKLVVLFLLIGQIITVNCVIPLVITTNSLIGADTRFFHVKNLICKEIRIQKIIFLYSSVVYLHNNKRSRVC